MQVSSPMLVLLLAGFGMWSAAAAAAATPTTLQPYALCGSSACTASPLVGSKQLACQGVSKHGLACPAGYSCQHQRNQAWVCSPAPEAASAATPRVQAATQTAKSRRSLAQAQVTPDNPAVATRTTDTTVAGSPPGAGSAVAADSNPAVDPRTTGETAPASATSSGIDAANPAVDTRTTDETVLGPSTSSAGSVGAATSPASLSARCDGCRCSGWLALCCWHCWHLPL
ncbi:hypothetical protein COO60DRAFT_1535077, partial [Scenedesmus sp. NREL 46B-D3]